MSEYEDYIHRIKQKFPKFADLKQQIEVTLKLRTENLVDQNVYKNNKKAAVLFPLIIPPNKYLINNDDYLKKIFILIEKRSKNLSNNPGDMSFPGGKMDKEDKDLFATAIREAEEEVGIPQEYSTFIDYMDEFVSSNDIVVRTVINWVQEEYDLTREELEKKYQPKTDETIRTAVIPLMHFLHPDYYFSTEFFRNGSDRLAYVRYYNIDPYMKHTHIWGLTASMIRRFVNIVFPDNLLQNEPV